MAFRQTLTYRFSELPLIVDGPFEDAGIEGEAEISYRANCEWSIESISIETSRIKTPTEMELTGLTSRRIFKQHVLDAGTPLYEIIYDRLETKYNAAIEDEVRTQVEEDRADALEFLADQRRDDRMMESVR